MLGGGGQMAPEKSKQEVENNGNDPNLMSRHQEVVRLLSASSFLSSLRLRPPDCSPVPPTQMVGPPGDFSCDCQP